MFRRLRSALYVPASKPKMLAKLPSLDADVFVVDLEDGVAPADKVRARDQVRRAAENGWLPEGRWVLRINGTGTSWQPEDLALVNELAPPAAVLPKAESPHEARRLAENWSLRGTATLLMVETAWGVARARELAGAHPWVTALVYGSADLRRSLGARPDPERRWESQALSEILLAARIHGCFAVDGVHFHYRDLETLEAEARVARDFGYDGKSCIHPGQIETVHRVFSSTPEEIRWARDVIRAWRDNDGEHTGVVVLDGEMIEALHLDVARRILDRADDAAL